MFETAAFTNFATISFLRLYNNSLKIFYISFLPYILGILWSIWNAATGIQMEGYVMYGISAFWTTIKLILLVTIYPVK